MFATAKIRQKLESTKSLMSYNVKIYENLCGYFPQNGKKRLTSVGEVSRQLCLNAKY